MAKMHFLTILSVVTCCIDGFVSASDKEFEVRTTRIQVPLPNLTQINYTVLCIEVFFLNSVYNTWTIMCTYL